MKHVVFLALLVWISGELFGQGHNVFPISTDRQHQTPGSMRWANPNDGSPAQSVLTYQGTVAPVKASHFGHTHPHFADASAQDTAVLARSQASTGLVRFPGEWQQQIFLMATCPWPFCRTMW